jgi:hypothetical protein
VYKERKCEHPERPLPVEAELDLISNCIGIEGNRGCGRTVALSSIRNKTIRFHEQQRLRRGNYTSHMTMRPFSIKCPCGNLKRSTFGVTDVWGHRRADSDALRQGLPHLTDPTSKKQDKKDYDQEKRTQTSGARAAASVTLC